MTREEIISEIKCLLAELDNGADSVSYLTQNDTKWLVENIKALKQEPNYKSFCKFVAKTIMEEDFELNAGANAEIFCRKLAELGIVRVDGDSWVLESEVEE